MFTELMRHIYVAPIQDTEHLFLLQEVKNQSCSCNYKKFGTRANRLEIQDGGIIVPNSSTQRTLLKSQDIVAFLKHNKVGANLILGRGLPLRSLHFWLLTFLKEETCKESPLSNIIGYAEITEKCDFIEIQLLSHVEL